ncbi:MAG: Rha family transcriptional regulator [Aeromonas sobria]
MNIISREMTTMSSREIAELTGKRHDNVMRDIRNMMSELGVLKSEETYNHPSNGQEYSMFSLSKEETLCLVAGYHAKLRMAIIKRWGELEEAIKQPALPDNFIAVDKDEYIATLRCAFESVNRQRNEAVAMLEDHKKLAVKEGERGLMDAVLSHVRAGMRPVSRDEVAASRKSIRKPDGRFPLKREVIGAFDRLIENGELLNRREGFYDVLRPVGFYDF